MLKILWTYILFLLFISASARAEKPWYFDAIGLTETTMSLTDKNTPVVVSVVDSGVAFIGGLSDSEFAKFSFTQDGSPFPVKSLKLYIFMVLLWLPSLPHVMGFMVFILML